MRTKAVAKAETSRDKLIQSAERLFAERGYDGVSVRDIANDAKVNSALVGYYFRGKEGLLAAVYTLHCEPLNAERLRMLTECTAGGRKPKLEEVLDAFIRPSLQAGRGSASGRSFSRLRAILAAENTSLLEQLVAKTFDETNLSFIDALCACLPHISREDVFWRFHFLLGAIYYTATGPYRVKSLSGGKCDPSDPVLTTTELIFFAAAGFRSTHTATRKSDVPTDPMKSSRPRIRKRA